MTEIKICMSQPGKHLSSCLTCTVSLCIVLFKFNSRHTSFKFQNDDRFKMVYFKCGVSEPDCAHIFT